MEILKLTITSCIHLIRSNLVDYNPKSLGSGVIIRYKDRYFICTVAHFSDHPDQNIGIVTGRIKDHKTELFSIISVR